MNITFDSKKFDENKQWILDNLPILSPKMVQLFKKIEKLDAQDMHIKGKYFNE